MTNSTDIIFVQTLGCYVMIEYTSGLRSISFVKSKDKIKEKKTLGITFELERYFKGEKTDFSCDVDISHLSPFTQKVLVETRKIGYGKTIPYSQLAKNIGCRGARAVGGALARNPIPIVIPCHRVVAKNGIGGYSSGVDIKTRLLELESQ
ncbi:MAG: methylated-DNA--[protein]-cysteine S-methyltransferase [Candidatus Methanoperedens sp.]